MRMPRRAVVCLLLAIAVSAAVLVYLRRGPHAQSAAIPDLISRAPADAPFLFYADLAALRASPFLTQLAAVAPSPSADREYAEFVRATGFDYSRDLDRVVVAARPGTPTSSTVAVAEGRFDREKIASYALRTGKKERQNGVDVYVVPAGTPGKTVAFAFLDANRIALADSANLAPVLVPGTAGGLGPAMRERISRVSGAAILAVGQVGPVPENVFPGGVRSDQFTNLARSLRWISLAARPEGDRMKVALEGECDTPENATQIAGTLDGLRLFGQAALSNPGTRQRLPPETLKLLETLLRVVEVSHDSQRVRLTVELTAEMLRAATPKTPATNAPRR
jgi:hypothetical protein